MNTATWWRLDDVVHWLYDRHLLPARVKHWVCDRFDLSLGLTPEQLRLHADDSHSPAEPAADDWSEGVDPRTRSAPAADDWTVDDTLTERQIRDRLDQENWTSISSVEKSEYLTHEEIDSPDDDRSVEGS